jgi:hypothetical protein
MEVLIKSFPNNDIQHEEGTFARCDGGFKKGVKNLVKKTSAVHFTLW